MRERCRLKLGVKILLGLCLLVGAGVWLAHRPGWLGHRAAAPLSLQPAAGSVKPAAGSPIAAPSVSLVQPSNAVLETAFALSPSSLDDEDPSTFIALRYDKTHVVFLFGNNIGFMLKGPDEEKMLHSLPNPVTKYGVAPTSEPDPKLWDSLRQNFEGAHVGERWQLEVSSGARIPVVVQKPIEMTWGCEYYSYASGFIAEVAPESQSAFEASPSNYFLIHTFSEQATSVTKPVQTTIGALRDWKPTPEIALQIEQVITTRIKEELAKQHSKPDISVGETNTDENRDTVQEAWRQFEAKVASGEGKLTYDMQAFRLSPDGLPRLFVRARWMVDHKRALLVSMWLRAGARVTAETDEEGGARAMWLSKGFYSEDEMVLSQLGEVLNVFDRPDGYGDVLVYIPGYEGYDIHLFRYTDAGLAATKISQGDGC